MTECEFCDAVAVGEVHAQWTVVDFDDIKACQTHWAAAKRRLSGRRVDGHLPTDMWEVWYDFTGLPQKQGQP